VITIIAVCADLNSILAQRWIDTDAPTLT